MADYLREIDERFVARAEGRVEITAIEWELLRDAVERGHADSGELYRIKRELERVQRISRPLWRACRHVRDGMERAISTASRESAHVALAKVREWEIDLRLGTRVDITDLPAGHPAHSEFKR